MRRLVISLGLMLVTLGTTVVPARAQVFIAANARPEFSIAPLFLSVSVKSEDVAKKVSPVTVTVSWSVAPAPNRTPAEIAQDLYLLWPGEVVGTVGDNGADPTLARQVEALGFTIKEHGVLSLAARNRSAMGTGTGAQRLGDAPFVTLSRRETLAHGSHGATFIRIPWKAELASVDWLARLELPVRDVIVPRPVSWLEEMFWGRRHIVTVSFADVGYVSLYPLYYGARHRVVPLAPDFSLLLVNFADANHLRVDEVAPVSARRRPSETRENTETFSLPILASDGITPQLLKVQFTYFRGKLPWRPILFSALLLGLGNLTGPLVSTVVRRLARVFRSRIHVGRGESAGRARGHVPPSEVLERVRPGETSYEDTLRLCGGEPEEEQRLPSGEIRAVIYRGQRVVPRRQRSFGWVSTVSHWDVEQHEVQIDFEGERVRGIQARVRRARLAEPAG
jgi:hypothetical protein